MDIPRSFVPNQKDEKRLDKLLNTKERSNLLLEYYLNSWKYTFNSLTAYNIGERACQNIAFTKCDLEELSKAIIEDKSASYDFGSYLSALCNHIQTRYGEIILRPEMKLNNIGTWLNKGTLVVKASVGSAAGDSMKNGTLIIEGDTEDCPGLGMIDGTIIVYGRAGKDTGLHSNGGVIKAYKGVESIATDYCLALVCDKNGKKIQPE